MFWRDAKTGTRDARGPRTRRVKGASRGNGTLELRVGEGCVRLNGVRSRRCSELASGNVVVNGGGTYAGE